MPAFQMSSSQLTTASARRACKGGFGQRVNPGPEHDESERHYAEIQEVELQGDETEHQIDCAPDNAGDSAAANRFAGADHEERLILS